MMSFSYIPLRNHSTYSLAEGAIKFPELIQKCQELKLPAVALTDTGNLFGVVEFSKMAASAGIQPIIGCQLLVDLDTQDPRSQETRLPGIEPVLDTLLFYAQNEKGYKNLLKLVSYSYLHHKTGSRPYIPFNMLESYSEGLIVLSGGMKGGVNQLLLKSQKAAAKNLLLKLSEIFPDHFYVEITRQGLSEEEEVEALLLEIVFEAGIPLVATNEAFFVNEDMYEAHDALMCIASGRYVSEASRPRLTLNHRLKSPEEMKALFSNLPEALENTVRIAQRCGFMVEAQKPMLPPFPSEKPEPEELRLQAKIGLENRLKEIFSKEDISPQEAEAIRQKYFERLEQELEIVIGMGYAGYYLIVADFIQWANSQGIPVGPGRGSGAGSLVAWVLTITGIDPIRFGLIFERFLNPERISMPDFDIDFCQDRRDEVIRYVCERYGNDRVAQIITFGKLQARAVLRDVGRVLGMPYGQVDRICKLIPNNPTSPITLKEAVAQDPQLQGMAAQEEVVARLLDIGMKLEGLNRHASTHAAGIVIGDRSLDELVPLYYDGKSTIPATQFNLKDVESVGLVKFDFLGLKTLTIIQKTIDMVKARGEELDISQIPIDDSKTFEMLRRVETVGIFQLEGSGMRDVLRRLQPSRFEEIIDLNALYRPGPMDDIPRYLACKHGEETVDTLHPMLDDILRVTYGVMVYQEQVIKIAQVMGGYTLGGADLLRRAMGKKIKSEMDAQRQIFLSGAQQKGVDGATASRIFDLMAKFAGYGFNKSHSAPYALISYQTAFLKANYPVQFMAATMTYDINNTDKLSFYRQELKRMKVALLPPDINTSMPWFSVEKDYEGQEAVRYALAAIKSVGEAAMQELVNERERAGPFKDIIDFARRLSSKVVNKRLLEGLIPAGVFDSLDPNRAQLMANVDIILRYVGEAQAAQNSTQGSLFGHEKPVTASTVKFQETDRWTRLESLQYEFNTIGFYLSAHPLDVYGDSLQRLYLITSSDFHDYTQRQDGASFSAAGVLISKKERISKNGNKYAFITFSDATGVYEVTVFSEVYLAVREKLDVGKTFFMKLTSRIEEENLRLTVTALEELDKVLERYPKTLQVYLQNAVALDKFKMLLSKCDQGSGAIQIILKPLDREVHLTLDKRYAITPQLKEALTLISGIEAIRDV
ncbi:MAG: DNA polymerase III subunit alpha [Candidatus Paracaedimonas acanthamoebae]|uniref:DNA polymerase III subunit alpha n=1 Tax=Candidatus Paracaedimonas acanthamoebae TaxID=244581 RepID=A0A8J7PSG0_9PROT|nr:DNA polymerase III subunit alpha [Candidatus Paracaedimonas acanthamoebae]